MLTNLNQPPSRRHPEKSARLASKNFPCAVASVTLHWSQKKVPEEIVYPEVKCFHCAFAWIPRVEVPKRCARRSCGRPDWNVPKKRKCQGCSRRKVRQPAVLCRQCIGKKHITPKRAFVRRKKPAPLKRVDPPVPNYPFEEEPEW